MPTLKAEFSGGVDGNGDDAGGADGNNQEHTVILFNISYDTNEHNSKFLTDLKQNIIDKLSQEAKAEAEAEAATDAEAEAATDAEAKEQKLEEKYETFLKNEIGYGISVACEPPIPTSKSLISSKKPQSIGITLDLTHLNLKTHKEAKEIFEICRNEYYNMYVQMNT